MTEPLAKPARFGPRTVFVPVQACDGCPALALRAYEDALGPHVEATCRYEFAPGDGVITSHWRRGRPAPAWCPGRES
jgi:hypothetical protein